MSNLALLGGSPVFEEALDYRSVWPPVTNRTAESLTRLYFSRKWTAFDEAEPAFAQSFAAHHGARFGVFTINGTVTLQCALAACRIKPGDEVIVPPLTWYATAMAVRHVGAHPVFVDIKPDTLCIDPKAVEAAITPRTRAIIPVHAYGSMADMDALREIAGRYDLRVIEDCAHVPGGFWRGQGAGTLGDVGSFSFQYTKTMSCGEGGICITNNAELADRIFRMKQIGYGRGEIPRHARSGPPQDLMCYNLRATAFHPVILQEQLEGLSARLDRYDQAARRLEQRLSRSTRIRFQKREIHTTRQSYFGMVFILDDPLYAEVPIEVFQKAFAAEGVPLYRAEGPIYRFILFNVSADDYSVPTPCVVTEQVCARALWMLHCFLGMDDSVMDRIAEAVEKVCAGALDLISMGRSSTETGAW